MGDQENLPYSNQQPCTHNSHMADREGIEMQSGKVEYYPATRPMNRRTKM
jgi:hypothetical protein